MLQNLLSTPVSGLAISPAGSESRGDGLANNLDVSSGEFDKSLILNDSSRPVLGVTGAASGSLGALVSDSISLPEQLLGSLQASLQTLLNELYPGKEFPPVGNLLPGAAPQGIAAALEHIAALASEVQAELQAILSADMTEQDAAGLANLAQQLDDVFSQLASGLAATGGATTAEPVATMAAAAPPSQGLGLPKVQAVAVPDREAQTAQTSAKALGSGATLVQVRSALVEVRDMLQHTLQQVSPRSLPQTLPQAGALVHATQLAERGASGLPPGLAVASRVSASLLAADKVLATASALDPAPAAGTAVGAASAAVQSLTAPAARGGNEASAARAQWQGASIAMPLTPFAGDQTSSAPGVSATLLPAVAALRTSALGGAGFELAPAGHTLEPLVSATQGSAGLSQPVAAQAHSTPPAGVHTFTTSVGLPVVNGQWGSQIAQRITWLTGQGIKAADIHLNPPELGPMQVRIDSTENAARVTISAHNAMTREALEMQLPRLRDLFAEQGLELVDVDVDVESRDFAGGDSQSAAGENDAGNDDTATPENALAAGANQDLAGAADGGAVAGATIVLNYALVDAYA